MSKSTSRLFFLLLSFILSACGPGQFLGPTLTPVPTITPTPAPTLTPTLPPTATSAPQPKLGITDQELVSFAEGLDYTLHEITIDGTPARKYISPEGYIVLTLVGQFPAVEKVILEIDFKNEDTFAATATWIYVLEIASNHAGKPAAEWVRENYQKAIELGRQEKVFNNSRVVLEAPYGIFRLTIEPAVN